MVFHSTAKRNHSMSIRPMIAPTNALPTTDRVAAIVAASTVTVKVSTGVARAHVFVLSPWLAIVFMVVSGN